MRPMVNEWPQKMQPQESAGGSCRTMKGHLTPWSSYPMLPYSRQRVWKTTIKIVVVTLDTPSLSARTGSGFVRLCGRSTVGTNEGPVALHRRPPLKG